jgi:hypothetical protein
MEVKFTLGPSERNQIRHVMFYVDSEYQIC